MSDDNPRLKEWLAKFDNPNDSVEQRIITHPKTRKQNQEDRQIILLEPLHYVGFWRRFFAFYKDNLILSVMAAMTHNWSISFLLAALYYIVLTSSSVQGTIGKLVIGAAVVDMNGTKLRPER